MGKSSSSSKKKRSRDSSKSRSRTRNKNRRAKSKRPRHRDDSPSYSDDSESGSSESLSSSPSSEDDYRRRKSGSRTQKEVKRRKKRRQRRFYGSDSSEGSRVLKKKKKSKRKQNYEGEKKTRPKKRLRRDVSVSSASSDSCSTGHSSDESEYETKRGRYERRDKDKKRSDKVKSQRKRSRDRSRSRSSCSQGTEQDDYQYEEKFTNDNNGKRLRSIITVVKNEFNDDENKEEMDQMVYDHDDYPSCRSIDSNDGGSKRVFEEKRHMECEKGEEAVVSSARCDESVATIAVMEKSSQVSDAGDDSKGNDDLESVLRKRALENLKRLRGGLLKDRETSMNPKDKSDYEKLPSTTESESKQIKSAKHESASSQDRKATDIAMEELSTTPISCTNKRKLVRSVWRRETLDLSSDTKQATELQNIQAKSTNGVSVDSDVPETSQTLTARNMSEKSERNDAEEDQQANDIHKEKASAGIGPCISGRKPVRAVWRRESRNPGVSVDIGVPETSEALAENNMSKIIKSNDANDATTEQSSSHAEAESGQVENKEGSQFEQKTMSVMRGGEMVQVSYKVYIPKKTPALARRTLKR